MKITFIPVENEDGTFCETEAEAVPRVGEWIMLRRNDLKVIASQAGYAIDTPAEMLEAVRDLVARAGKRKNKEQGSDPPALPPAG